MSAATAPAPGGAGLSHRQIMTALSGLMIGMFIAAVDQTIVSTALPSIVSDVGGINQLSWVVVSYLLTSTASTPLWGKLGDLYGRRRMFQAAIVLFLVGSLACGAAPTMLTLILARALQGVGGGGLYALCFAIVGDLIPPRQRGRYIGYFTAVFASASVIGPLAGGFLTDNLGWRWIFTINLPIGIAALAVTSAALRIPFERREARVDLVGAGLVVAGVTCLVLISVWGGDEYAWASPQIVGLAAGGVALLGLFLAWEARIAEPIVPLRLFRNPVVATTLTLSFLLGPIFYASSSFMPLFFQGVRGYSATNSGLLLAPTMAGISVAAIVTGRLTTRNGRYKRWVLLGTTTLLVGMVLLAQLDASMSTLAIALIMVVIGLGAGSAMPVLSTASQNAVELRDLGVVTATLTFIRTLGGSLGVAAFGAVLKTRLNERLVDIAAANPLPEGVTAKTLANRPANIHQLAEPLRGLVSGALAHSVGGVFIAAAPLTALALVVGWTLREQPLRDHAEAGGAQAKPEPEPEAGLALEL